MPTNPTPAGTLPELVEQVLSRGSGWPVPPAEPRLYLDLAETIVRQASRWQEPTGMVGDPYNAPGVESVTATARYAAALGHLLRAGRCHDLLDSAAQAMDWCCNQISGCCARGERWGCAAFNVKDMMVLYEALRPLASAEHFARWSVQLAAPAPEELYTGERNWLFYAAAAETLRIQSGLSHRWDYVDRLLADQMPWWTEFGMYRDPNDPVTYDLTVRQCLSLMLEQGYAGAHAAWARDVLRRGALATLLFLSPAGVAPYGGRSNQFHIMEGMLAYLAEWQAKQEARAGNLPLAGALRRTALAGAEATTRWILQDPYCSLKHQMAGHPFYGQDGYPPEQNAHSGYGLLAANLFAGAYHVADHAIPVGPAPADMGGYLLYLPDAFHRLWATAGSYHIQIDTRGQAGYDATGLGRLHRRGVPIEAGLNMSIVAAPAYRMPLEPARRSVALGVGWPCAVGWRYLSEAHRDTHDVTVSSDLSDGSVAFILTYRSRGHGLGTPLVRERYRLSEAGLRAECEVPGAARVRLQVPVIETDGRLRSTITVEAGCVVAEYAGHRYVVRVPGRPSLGTVESWTAPNRNGIYRVAIFEVAGPRVAYEATLA